MGLKKLPLYKLCKNVLYRGSFYTLIANRAVTVVRDGSFHKGSSVRYIGLGSFFDVKTASHCEIRGNT